MARALALERKGLNFNLALTLTTNVNLDKTLYFLEPQFPRLCTQTYLTGPSSGL